ncbi:MAG: response regulator transcription factor [Chitinophagales bacterium]
MSQYNILVVEDEDSLQRSISEFFLQEEFLCESASNFKEALDKIEDGNFDCIILDINLPGGSGLQLLQHLRKLHKEDRVIIISARHSLDDKIAGFNFGADDYLTKPFHLSELNARVKALLRRKYPQGADTIEMGGLKIEMLSRTASYSNRPISLTKNEYDLLAFLMTNRNRVVSRQAMAEHLYGEEVDNLPSLDFVYSQIKNLKKKMKDKGCEHMLQTIYGLGYKLSV